MTKYGHENDSTAISQSQAGIDQKLSFKKVYPNSSILLTYITLPIACRAKHSHFVNS